jgi:hypothetical protein
MKMPYFVYLLIFLLPLVVLSASETLARTYVTNFPLAEDPISERGNWINGKTVGLDWSNVATTPGLASGRESGGNGYDDSTALLTGVWDPDQTVTTTVHSVNQMGGNVFEEVEIRLRGTLSAHSCTGYEVNFRALKSAGSYVEIVRWNGPLGKFSYIARGKGVQYGITERDVVKASIIGNVITVYINNVQVLQVTDNTYSNGSPGMGFFLSGATGVNSDYGFTSFMASDGAGTSPPAARTDQHVLP